MKNGFGEVENLTSVLLVHVEQRKVDLGETYLKKMIKNYQELNNRRNGIFPQNIDHININYFFFLELDGSEAEIEEVEAAIEQLSRVMARKTLPTASTQVAKSNKEAESGGGKEDTNPRKLHSSRFHIQYGDLSSPRGSGKR